MAITNISTFSFFIFFLFQKYGMVVFLFFFYLKWWDPPHGMDPQQSPPPSHVEDSIKFARLLHTSSLTTVDNICQNISPRNTNILVCCKLMKPCFNNFRSYHQANNLQTKYYCIAWKLGIFLLPLNKMFRGRPPNCSALFGIRDNLSCSTPLWVAHHRYNGTFNNTMITSFNLTHTMKKNLERGRKHNLLAMQSPISRYLHLNPIACSKQQTLFQK